MIMMKICVVYDPGKRSGCGPLNGMAALQRAMKWRKSEEGIDWLEFEDSFPGREGGP